MQHITRTWFKDYIATHTPEQVNRMVGKALWSIFQAQTLGEQITNDTKILNGVGFSAGDARRGSIAAKTYKKRGVLIDFQLDYWLAPMSNGHPRISKYRKQLNAAAVAAVAVAKAKASAEAYRAQSRAGDIVHAPDGKHHRAKYYAHND